MYKIDQDITGRLLRRIEMVTESGCWIWLLGTQPNGYGFITLNGKTMRTHRVYYEHFRHPIPPGLQADHLCRVRCCVNPDHMEIVTGKVNTLRGNSASAINARKTHCRNGHPLAGDNLVIEHYSFRRRYCRICRNARWRQKSKMRTLKRQEARRIGQGTIA